MDLLSIEPWRVDAVETEAKNRARVIEPRVTAHLLFLTKSVHRLRGMHGLRVLQQTAEDFNAERYLPSTSGAGRCWADKAGWRGREAGMKKVGAAS
jgi:hypothetical protein